MTSRPIDWPRAAAAGLVAAALGATIWALSIPLTGKSEPWDSNGPYYVIALALAGSLSGATLRNHLLAQYVGAVAGQAVYELIFLPFGPLFVLGLAFLAAYTVVFLGAAALAGSAVASLREAPGAEGTGVSRKRLAVEAALVALATFALWVLLYNPLIERCCGPLDEPILWVILTSYLLGAAVVGDQHDRIAVLVGMVAEALLVWGLVRVGVSAVRRRRKSR